MILYIIASIILLLLIGNPFNTLTSIFTWIAYGVAALLSSSLVWVVVSILIMGSR